MGKKSNYTEILKTKGLRATANRLLVLEAVGEGQCSRTAAEIYQKILKTKKINMVTVYRILDLLESHLIINRIMAGSRTAHYRLAADQSHTAHPHFYCNSCATISCLTADAMTKAMEALKRYLPGQPTSVEVQIEGVCQNCLNEQR